MQHADTRGTEGTTEKPVVDRRSCAALIAEWAVCIVAGALALREFSLPVVTAAICVIATRQHALFILYHDAVHGLIARNRRLNDLIINIFVGIPLLIPVHFYRRFHLSHHAWFGTPCDTERILLYRWQPWDYRPLTAARLALQLLGDLLVVNVLLTSTALWRERRNPGSPLRLHQTHATPETLLLGVIFCALMALWVWCDSDSFWRVMLLWFGTFFTLTQLLQKVRSFAEHGPLGSDELTYSWRPGLLGRLILWPYNINCHREHHQCPGIPWHALPGRSAGSLGVRSGRELPGLLLAP
jgi:fatty acid desaturase